MAKLLTMRFGAVAQSVSYEDVAVSNKGAGTSLPAVGHLSDLGLRAQQILPITPVPTSNERDQMQGLRKT